MIAAQRHRDSYWILLVCSALESESRQILELPNPLAPRGAGRYRSLVAAFDTGVPSPKLTDACQVRKSSGTGVQGKSG